MRTHHVQSEAYSCNGGKEKGWTISVWIFSSKYIFDSWPFGSGGRTKEHVYRQPPLTHKFWLPSATWAMKYIASLNSDHPSLLKEKGSDHTASFLKKTRTGKTLTYDIRDSKRETYSSITSCRWSTKACHINALDLREIESNILYRIWDNHCCHPEYTKGRDPSNWE